MTLTDASDDDLIAEVQHRLDASRFGFHGLMARNQMDSAIAGKRCRRSFGSGPTRARTVSSGGTRRSS